MSADQPASAVASRILFGIGPEQNLRDPRHAIEIAADHADMVERDGTTTSTWTDPNVPGRRFGGHKPVYVLTSAATVSGGEALAYELKALRRATLIGETTVGAAKVMAVATRSDPIPNRELNLRSVLIGPCSRGAF